jgi:1-deoxy-D-xylulose-5-phosphate synthase
MDTSTITRLGIPDRFIEHGERGELLESLDLSADGLARVARDRSANSEVRAEISPEASAV